MRWIAVALLFALQAQSADPNVITEVSETAGEASSIPHSLRVDDARFSEVSARIQAEIQEGSVPSVSVAVAEHGKVVWEASFGWADRAKRIPATPDTVYAIASVTKVLTAMGVMVLAQREVVDLEGPLTAVVPSLRLRALDATWPEVRVRNLLNHTSGLPTHMDLLYPDESAQARSLEEVVRRYGILVHPPGTQFEYSNLGYGILGRLIGQASGQPLERFMHEAVFAPLGMKNTFIGSSQASGSIVATAYGADSDSKAIPHFLTDTPGAGEGYSTAHDLIAFAMLHLKDRGVSRASVLNEDGIDRMQSSFEPRAAYNYYGGARYGFGWYLHEDAGHRTVWHAGGADGTSAMIKFAPREDVAVVVLMNRFNEALVQDLSDALLRVVLPEHPAHSPRDSASFRPYATDTALLGDWEGEIETPEGRVPLQVRFQPDGSIRVTFMDHGLKSFLTQQSPIPHTTMLNYAMRAGDTLSGIFGGRLPSSDLSRCMDHLNRVMLVASGGELRGFVTAFAMDERERYGYSFPVVLKRSAAR